MHTNTAPLLIENVTKTYPDGTTANSRISIRAEKGEIIGLIGCNGAGKTTLVRQVLGLISPTSGTVRVLGHEMPEDSDCIKGRVGYVPQMPMQYPSLSPHELVGYILRMKGASKRQAEDRAQKILAQVGLEPTTSNQYAYQLSYGSVKLMNFAMALCQDAELLVLDEPTSMVDIVNQARVRELIADQRDTCVLLTTHNLSEVQALCDRVYLLAKGEVIASGLTQEMAELMGTPIQIVIAIQDPTSLHAALQLDPRRVVWNGSTCSIGCPSLKDALQILSAVDEGNVGYEALRLDAPALEQTVLQLLKAQESS